MSISVSTLVYLKADVRLDEHSNACINQLKFKIQVIDIAARTVNKNDIEELKKVHSDLRDNRNDLFHQ